MKIYRHYINSCGEFHIEPYSVVYSNKACTYFVVPGKYHLDWVSNSNIVEKPTAGAVKQIENGFSVYSYSKLDLRPDSLRRQIMNLESEINTTNSNIAYYKSILANLQKELETYEHQLAKLKGEIE